MSLKWYGPNLNESLNSKIGKGLARCAEYFETQHKLRLNKSNPAPYLDSSKPGEYPRARTGFGRRNHTYDPASPDEMAAEGAVRLGYLQNAWYMAFLEVYRGRLGLVHTMNTIKAQMARLLNLKIEEEDDDDDEQNSGGST